MDELCGNASKYLQIKAWLLSQCNKQNQQLSTDSLLFVCGNSGIGKTYSIKHIANILNLHMVYISSHNCLSANDLNDMLIKNTTSSMLQLLSNDRRQKIIVIDDFESMMAIDRTINTVLLNILNQSKLKHIPIICIASADIVKKIGTMKKKCKIIELTNPSDEEIMQTLKDKYECENLQSIVKVCNGNISQCINQLNNTCDIMDNTINIELLFSNEYNRDNIRKIIMTDPWLIPLRFHENLITELKGKKCNIAKMHCVYKKFMYDMLYFDILVHHNCLDIACDYFASMVYFLYIMVNKQRTAKHMHSFTKVLSYLSLQKKFAKKSYSSSFPLYQIGNYHTNIIGRNFIFFN